MLIAVPNISEGRDVDRISATHALLAERVRVLDVHSDGVHNRTVFTVAGDDDDTVAAMCELALACRDIDMTVYDGVHPALGGLDVVPFVMGDEPNRALAAATTTARTIGEQEIPVYLYGHAARRPAAEELPDLRKGGLRGLSERARHGFTPDEGPSTIDPYTGVVCIGARGVLIAFNVWLTGSLDAARAIARDIRVPGKLRALGVDMGGSNTQVTMNLIAPEELGIDEAFVRVARAASARVVGVTATEIVGLVPERFLPEPNAEAARLLMEPGRSLESAISA